jgi:hypothetical protein
MHSSIQNRDLKEQLHLGAKRNINNTFRETLEMEIGKRLAGSSVGIRKMGLRTLWRGLPLQNKRRNH